MEKFSIEGFVEGIQDTVAQAEYGLPVAQAYLADVIRKHGADEISEVLEAAIPPGASIGEMIVYRSPKITVLYARVPPRFRSGVHNHTVCAVIGQLSGEERSVVYERSDGGSLQATETIAVKAGEVMTLKRDAIHHIENPTEGVSSALHVYAGDFGALMGERSLWSAETGQEGPFTFEGLVAESARAMKQDGNDQGLEALVRAIPAAEQVVASL